MLIAFPIKLALPFNEYEDLLSMLNPFLMTLGFFFKTLIIFHLQQLSQNTHLLSLLSKKKKETQEEDLNIHVM